MSENDWTQLGWDNLPADPVREKVRAILDEHPRLCDCGHKCFHPDKQGGRAWCRGFFESSSESVVAIATVSGLFYGARPVKAGPASVMAHDMKTAVEECLRGVHRADGYVSEGELIAGVIMAGFDITVDSYGCTHLGVSKKDCAIFRGSRSAASRRTLVGLDPLWIGSRKLWDGSTTAPDTYL